LTILAFLIGFKDGKIRELLVLLGSVSTKKFKNEEMKMLMNKNYWEGPTCQSRNKNHMGKTKYNTFLIKCVLQT
jgi:hypothetical protein